MTLKGILLSATYQDRRCILKFYDPESNHIILWKDNTNHLPHCLIKPEMVEKIRNFPGIVSLDETIMRDVLKDEQVTMVNVIAKDPLVIGGKTNSIREMIPTYESDIKYYQTYLYDNDLIVGKWYDVGEKITPLELPTKEINLKDVNLESVIDVEKFKQYLADWVKILDQPIPKFRRVAFDIEVEGQGNIIPDPMVAKERVTAISFESEDLHQCFILNRPEKQLIDTFHSEPDPYILKNFDSEKQMLEEAFAIIESYPISLTYNGDVFDMPYLYNRAINLGIKNIPLRMMVKNATLALGIHIDLYGFFSNHSMQVYTFNSKYSEHGLEAVSSALLGEHKKSWEGRFEDMPLDQLASYCYNDSRLTYKLSSYNDNMVMNLLVILARIANMPIDDISRLSISHWIKSMIYFKHRKNNEIIPNPGDFVQVEASTKAMIEGKKYEGAMVLDPVKGVHFDVTVMDFASLYPSIIKTKNISYETVRCPHEECKANKIPLTNHWACTKRIGSYPLLLGTLKEVRVGHFKKLMRNETDKSKKEQYDAITQAIKVFLVAGYGVVGFESFPLYFLPTAESVTAYGRSIIQKTVEEAKRLGMTVIAGDTDSMFIKQASHVQKLKLIEYATRMHKMDLEADKEYRYVVLSDRKKNYFGIKKDGTTDIKGLTGKKSHTPPFLKELFTYIMNILKRIETPEQFESDKELIKVGIKGTIDGFDDIPLEKLVFRIGISKDPKEYKIKPQAVKAAEMLGKPVVKGQLVSFIKTTGNPNVLPLELAKRENVDKPKYIEAIQSTLEQITEPMGIDFDVILGKGRKTKIDEWIGSPSCN